MSADIFCPVGRGFDSGVGLSTFCLGANENNNANIAKSKRLQSDAPHYNWQYFTVTNHAGTEKKIGQRMLSVLYVANQAKSSVPLKTL